MSKPEEQDVYLIPPNFIDSGTLLGGLLKLRNVIEAGVLGAAVGLPISSLPISLTARIVILCLTALPLALFALIGINGEPQSSFAIGFIKYLKARRVIGKETVKKQESEYLNPTAAYLPIQKIENGVVYTADRRYIKVLEVLPINFLLRSAREQRSILYSFVSYLKISPVKMQFKVLTKRADTEKHRQITLKEMDAETDPNCRKLQEDYLSLIGRIGSREATTRRFFLIFEYESVTGRGNEEDDAVASLQIAARTAVNYLKQCGNEVLTPENEDEFTADVYYNILCRKESAEMPLAGKVQQIVSAYRNAGKDTGKIPCAEFFAPKEIDVTNGRYIRTDGLYQAYFLVPSDGYRTQVAAGWFNLLVNAGDGIDVDLFLFKQPKERMVQRLGQQLRINRSKIKEACDTNSDFDSLDDAIKSGYFLKDGLAGN